MSMLSMVKKGKDRLPPRILIYGSEGVGKAQPKDAMVLTPRGFVPIGSIRVGDRVTGSDGKAYNVTSVHPQGKRLVYRVTFRDGSSTRCCGEHLWLTRTVEERLNEREGSVRTLSEIRATLRENSHFNHDVPRVRPVEFAPPQTPLPVEPYALGLQIGDGCASALATFHECPDEKGILSVSVQCKRGSRNTPPGEAIMKCLGVDGLKPENRFIPQQYLLASIEERIALLRGLLDCNDAVRDCGLIEFGTVSRWLAHDLCFLIRSLGGMAMLGDKDGVHVYAGRTFTGDGCTYRIHASFPNGIMTGPGEAHSSPCDPSGAGIPIRRMISSVEPLGEEECMCIRTEAPDSLYVTDDFILTHNSTYAAQIPSVIFIDTEGGLSEIDCVRFPQAASFSGVMEQLKALAAEKHEYGAVAIDSCDWLERLVWEEVCKDYGVNSIEKAAGGYGKGYIEAANRFRKLLELLDKLRLERGMAIILIAHSRVEPFTDPEVGTYDRYSPRLHKHASAIVGEWVDAILFATRRISVQNASSGDGKVAKGIGANGGERILRCEGGPACVAKNRYNLPFELPLSWDSLMAALTSEPSSAKA